MPSAPLYLDHAATTPVRPEVLEAMLPYLGRERFGNPSSAHQIGRSARAGLELARQQVADALGVEQRDVLFTSGGTEANNFAIIGAALAARRAGGAARVAVAATEHKSTLAAAHAVGELGGAEHIIPVATNGLVEREALDAALALRPAVLSIMWVNNETGVIHPIAEIAYACAAAGVPFHTDMVQAFGKLPTSLRDLPATFATISGHKLGAPKGIGALIARDRTQLAPLIHGGGQQGGLRPGTENIAGAVGLGRAAVLAVREQAAEAKRLEALRTELLGRIRAALPEVVVAGEPAPRAPHILNLLVPGADSEALLMHLDLAGLAASGGSACASGAIEPSHVLLAMGYPQDLAAGAVRLSLGRETTQADITRAAEVVPEIVARVRRLAAVLGRG
jgi:cysteine desulfurase